VKGGRGKKEGEEVGKQVEGGSKGGGWVPEVGWVW